MPTLPSSLSLENIAGQILKTPHNNNYGSVQSVVNALISIFGGGTAGQQLQSDGGTTVAWKTVPAARVFHGADQSTTTGVALALLFGSERFDTDTIHDTVTNTSRLTCRTAGKYLIAGHAYFASNSTGIRELGIRLNGTTFIADDLKSATFGGVHACSISTIWDMAVNDYVELMATQTSGGNLNVVFASAYSPEFSMVRVG